ncbi:lantibiotic dehydratase [Planomonospora sp. ID82291]|uniref:lantibiotic dehydratase n=1 Tax=Planomonospora sp. ID82291 TaxID=2738136 RepID=UPI0018C3ABB8|nr:lantibiotic dehydratase [Planomonospora sp. ID82291]
MTTRERPARETEHHTPLGGSGWLLWRECALRGTGFPADWFAELCDAELAAAADRLDERVPATGEQWEKTFAAAADRRTAVMRRAAADPLFREAVAWQNPQVVRVCLDKTAGGEPRSQRESRRHELTITTYLQRYCLKNDTVGFFGPLGWARIGAEDTGLELAPGPGLLARRTVYFEGWAIDAVAEAVAARPEVWPWLRPRRDSAATLTKGVLRLPFRKPVTLQAAELRVLGRCDGRHTIRDIAGDPPDPAAVAVLLRLRECGAVRLDLNGKLVTWPERELAERIDLIADPAVRARARASLDELVGARDAMAAAAGDAERLMEAQRELAETFERITGRPAVRRSGGVYAGRTLVYEDTVRDLGVRLGRKATDALAAPLGLVLDSARWLVNSVAERYEAGTRRLLDRETARTGARTMPLLQVLTSVMPELGALTLAPGSEVVDEVVGEFRRRWRRVIGLPLEEFGRTRDVRLTAEAIAGRVAEEFATGAPRWSAARCFSPDLMLMAADEAALARGDLDFVLGELHCAANTLENKVFVNQHPDPRRLHEAAVASRLDERVVIVPRVDSPLATTRMSRADEVMLPSYTYLCIGAESFEPPPGSPLVSVLDLVVERRGDDLIVRHRSGGGREHSFLEVAGDLFSVLVVDAFKPFDGAPHRPRITVDRLVVSREAWTFPVADVAWAFVKDERRRYVQARRWHVRHGLPERGFVRLSIERKPIAVDFRSLSLVNLLGKFVRRTAEAGSGAVTITEMLPDTDRLWLRDARGARYTAELRIMALAHA